MAILNNSNAISSGGYDINNSLRFRSSASASLTRTPAGAGNRKTWTWSGWVKRGTLSATQGIFSANTDDNNKFFAQFNSNNTFEVLANSGGGTVVLQLTTTQVFRDPSAWYHIVVALDTTQATSSNRAKVYVNGSQVTAFGTATYPSQNTDINYNQVATTSIGSQLQQSGGTSLFDGYMTEINFINASQLTPSDFGETDTTTGSWKPKAYTGTYGTNGFYLKFSDIATTSGSNAGLGKDFSGNANYWTTNNISVTAGVTYDAMIDSPTLTSATVANYSVLNAVNTSSNTITDGNLKTSFSAVGGNRNTIGMSSGKWYWEVSPTTCPSFTEIGIVSASVAITGDISAVNAISYMSHTGYWWRNNVGTAYGATYTTTDVIGIAVDIDNNTITFYKNGTSQGAITSVTLNTDTWFACMGNAAASATVGIYNFGQRPFAYTPPTGFVRLNTYNLPDSTIKKGNTVMDATLWTGNGTSQSIVNAGAFKPDFVWVKSRSNTFNNNLFNSTSGVNKFLVSDTTAAEASVSGTLTAFNSNGFSVGSDIGLNFLSGTYVGWQWQAGQGSTSSNTSGSITSTVSVSTTAGFSVVTYTGNATANATVGHGLGVAPKFFVVKTRSGTSEWLAYHISTGKDGFMQLQSTSAFTSSANYWGSTGPTSTTFQINGGGGVNSNGSTYVAYCWAEIAGFSKFTSYTGNGSADGPFVYCNFRPKFVMIKRTVNAGGSWAIYDSSRNTYNVANLSLYPNLSSADDTYDVLDFTSNGFKIRTSSLGVNQSGDTFIVAAFAENPFKNALAR